MKKPHLPYKTNDDFTHVSNENLNSDLALLPIEEKFVLLIADFVKGIFNQSIISVHLKKIKITHAGKSPGVYSEDLTEKSGHLCFQFISKPYKNFYYDFHIKNIPAHSNSYHIRIFFEVIKEYISDAYSNIQKNLALYKNKPAAASTQISKSDIWLYNIEQTIIIQYLFKLFNNISDAKPTNACIDDNPCRYDLDLINTIYSFGLELNRKKIESKDIYCGFIFHDSEKEIKDDSVRSIAFKEKVNFGDIDLIKDYLTTSDGENTFFNVTNHKITHLFVIKKALTDLGIHHPVSDNRFLENPLILSVQGNSKIYLMKGLLGYENIVFQIFNSKPLLRDYNFIENYISKRLKAFSVLKSNRVKFLSKWILSSSLRRHGTSFIFLDVTIQIEEQLVKTVRIKPDKKLLLEPEIEKFDFILLDSIVNTDGAVIFDSSLVPTHISTILPITSTGNNTYGGARHNSLANFTKKYNCLGIVISEDGPISIFKNGKLLIKF